MTAGAVKKLHELSSRVETSAIHLAARRVCEALQAAGHQAQYVGGAVRDVLLNPDSIPADIDICTSASPEAVAASFPGSGFVGKNFGVSLVRSEGIPFEVATYRCEGAYSDRRHPDSVRNGTQEEDSRRRDFTINALYFDPVSSTLTDFHGGLACIEARRLACVGDARARLFEDPLRILRMFRFAVSTGFDIDPATLAAAREPEVASGMGLLSRERVLMEIVKVKPGRAGDFFGAFLGEFAAQRLDGAFPAPFKMSASDRVDSLHNLVREDLWTRQPELHKRFPATALGLCIRAACGGSEDALFSAFSAWPLQTSDRELLRVVLSLRATQQPPAEDTWDGFVLSSFFFHKLLRNVREATPREVAALVSLPGAIGMPEIARCFAHAADFFHSEVVRSALALPEFLRWVAGASFPHLPSRAKLAALHASEKWPLNHLGILNGLWEAFAVIGDAVPQEFHESNAEWPQTWKTAAHQCAAVGKVFFDGLKLSSRAFSAHPERR